jgi:hypothetical protein
MEQVIPIIISVAAVGFFVWMMLGYRMSGKNVEIDPSDERQIGTLMGLTGGTIQDAAVARFALRRFEEQHGRKATVRDMGIVAGLMRSGL